MKEYNIDFYATYVVKAENEEEAKEKFWNELPTSYKWVEIQYVEEK